MIRIVENAGIINIRLYYCHCLITIVMLISAFAAGAQTIQGQPDSDVDNSNLPEDTTNNVVSYPSTYFEKFRPNTALDMVRQIPGFQIIDNSTDTTRGFGTAVGNLFINDRRPTAKQDSLPAILSRIPAVTVQQIELIRGQIRNIDLRGQTSVINIVLRDDLPAAYQWEIAARKTFGHGPINPEMAMSVSDIWRGIEYNAGVDLRPSAVGRTGQDEIFDDENVLVEERFEKRENRNKVYKPSLTASGWIGETLIQLNTNYTYEDRYIYSYSQRVPHLISSGQSEVIIDDDRLVTVIEAGLDLERSLTDSLTGKGIFLYVQREDESSSLQRNLNAAGSETLSRIADSQANSTEIITRMELDWTGLTNHLFQANLERANNILDGSLVQFDDTGTGRVLVTIPGANSRIEETRWDFLLKDTWQLEKIELELGLGAETSTIAQSGDAEQERDFFFLKPQAAFSYISNSGNRTQVRIAREVAQLDLLGFLSTTVFEDDDLALGNPDLQPDSTWKLELSHDKRFSSNSTLRFTVFHHWISDVIDLLPITVNFEAPGNIGDGRRWGVQLEGSMPLDWLGLTGSKLNVKTRWQDSTVIDPVTDIKRVLSAGTVSTGPILFNVENKYGLEMDYRQDFQQQRIAWGWLLKERAQQYQFKVNELEIYDDGMDIHVFVETTRWFGVKTQLLAENILDLKNYRDRTIYVDERMLSPLNSVELREQTRGIRLLLSVSGSF